MYRQDFGGGVLISSLQRVQQQAVLDESHRQSVEERTVDALGGRDVVDAPILLSAVPEAFDHLEQARHRCPGVGHEMEATVQVEPRDWIDGGFDVEHEGADRVEILCGQMGQAFDDGEWLQSLSDLVELGVLGKISRGDTSTSVRHEADQALAL